jgi:DNA-binding Lrp family transcriptional regulator
MSYKEEKIRLDSIDKQIVAMLQEDGRMKDVEIAKKLGISHDTATRRRKKLEDHGFFEIRAALNPRKFGFTNSYFLGLVLTPGADVRQTAKELMLIDEVFFVALSLGPTHSLVAHCRAKDPMMLNSLVEQLRKWPQIERIDVNIIYEVLKSGYHRIPTSQL